MSYSGKKIVWFGACLILFFVWFLPVQAKKTLDDASAALGTVASKTGIEEKDVKIVAGKAAAFAFSAVGIIFFILMVYAGIRWMTARGDEDKATKARNTIIAATIGLIIVVSAYAITKLVIDRIVTGKEAEKLTPTAPNTQGGEKLGCCIYGAATAAGDIAGLGDNTAITTNEACQIENTTKQGCTNGEQNKKCRIFFAEINDIDQCENKLKQLQ